MEEWSRVSIAGMTIVDCVCWWESILFSSSFHHNNSYWTSLWVSTSSPHKSLSYKTLVWSALIMSLASFLLATSHEGSDLEPKIGKGGRGGKEELQENISREEDGGICRGGRESRREISIGKLARGEDWGDPMVWRSGEDKSINGGREREGGSDVISI